MKVSINQMDQVNAMKEFMLNIEGPDELATWFVQTLTMLTSKLSGKKQFCTYMGDDTWRYTNGTNGGLVFVYVRNGKIVRITPIEFDDKDAQPWTIHARGKEFTPPRKATLSPYTYSIK